MFCGEQKIGFGKKLLKTETRKIFSKISPPPGRLDTRFIRLVKDIGDVHLLTSSKNAKADYLVSLDKKHILSLKKKLKDFKIVSPGELIQILEA